MCLFLFATLPSKAIGGVGVKSAWSWDIHPVCQKIALEWKSKHVDHSCSHVFFDIVDCLPPHIQELVGCADGQPASKRPKAAKDDEWQQRKNDNDEFAKYMMAHATQLFTAAHKSDCLKHRKGCICGGYPDVAITREMVGSSCQEESPFGTCASDGGLNRRYLIVWAARVRALRPTYFQHENHKNMPYSFFQFWFEDLYQLDFFTTADPAHFGWPVNRPGRRYVWGVRRDHVLLGDAAHFVRSTAHTCQLVGDDLFQATDQMIKDDLDVLLRNRKFKPGLATEEAGDWLQYYPPGMVGNSLVYKREFADSGGLPLIADLEHGKGYGPKSSEYVPTLITHGTIHSFILQRRATGQEHLMFQGVPVLDSQLADMGLKELPWQSVLETLSRSQLLKLAGNAMFLPGLIAQDLYILSRLHKRGVGSVGSLFSLGPLGRANSLEAIEEFEADAGDDR